MCYGRRKEEEKIFLGDEGIDEQNRRLLWQRGDLWRDGCNWIGKIRGKEKDPS